jgi:hypothetical protein
VDITDSWKGVVANFVVTGGQITEITTPTQVFGFNYNWKSGKVPGTWN